jgi:hypothetical protein
MPLAMILSEEEVQRFFEVSNIRALQHHGACMNKFSRGIAAAAITLLVASGSSVHALCAAPKNVSGTWTSNDGGTYRLHVVGDTVWWVGMSGDGGSTWTNAFKGIRSGNIIDGEWADVRGAAWGHGTMKLRISGTTSMERIGGTGSGFGGSRWGRGGCNDTP